MLDAIEAGTARAEPQPADGVSLAPKLTVEDARVRWADPAFAVDRRIRACTPAPGAWTTLRDDRLKLGPVRPVANGPALKPGRAAGRTHPGAGRHGDHAGDARRGPGGRQEADAGHRLGARPARRAGGAVRVTDRRARPTGAHRGRPRPAPAAVRAAAATGGDRGDRPGAGPRPARRSDPARQAAYEAIAAVHRDDAYANLVLPGILRERGLHGRDAAFATELTYGTLRALRHPRR